MRTQSPSGSNALRGRAQEGGFTLVEALVAIVVLAFGLIAVTNLLLVGATSNSVANQATAAATAASETLEDLKRIPFADDLGNPNAALADGATGTRTDDVAGVGRIVTTWSVTAIDDQTRFITVQSEGTGALARSRSRARFTTLRSCTAEAQGCPDWP